MSELILKEKTDSITLKVNAKGEYYWDIKVYYDSDKENNEDVLKKVSDMDFKLKGLFRK